MIVLLILGASALNLHHGTERPSFSIEHFEKGYSEGLKGKRPIKAEKVTLDILVHDGFAQINLTSSFATTGNFLYGTPAGKRIMLQRLEAKTGSRVIKTEVMEKSEATLYPPVNLGTKFKPYKGEIEAIEFAIPDVKEKVSVSAMFISLLQGKDGWQLMHFPLNFIPGYLTDTGGTKYPQIDVHIDIGEAHGISNYLSSLSTPIEALNLPQEVS